MRRNRDWNDCTRKPCLKLRGVRFAPVLANYPVCPDCEIPQLLPEEIVIWMPRLHSDRYKTAGWGVVPQWMSSHFRISAGCTNCMTESVAKFYLLSCTQCLYLLHRASCMCCCINELRRTLNWASYPRMWNRWWPTLFWWLNCQHNLGSRWIVQSWHRADCQIRFNSYSLNDTTTYPFQITSGRYYSVNQASSSKWGFIFPPGMNPFIEELNRSSPSYSLPVTSEWFRWNPSK